MPRYVATFWRNVPQVVGSKDLGDVSQDEAVQHAVDYARETFPAPTNVSVRVRRGQELDAPIVGHVDRG